MQGEIRVKEAKELTVQDVIGMTVHTLVKRGVPGAAVFVGLCYQLQRDNKFTVEEVTALATRFVLGGEVKSDDRVESKWDDVEEREWDALFQKRSVQASLRRMAVEAKRQFHAGETEEGGFGIE